jgi:hypothetical protein
MNDVLAMDRTALKEALEAKSQVEVLEDRFDRHLDEMRAQTKELAVKVDMMNMTMNQIHVDLVGKIGDTNIRIYTVNGLISAFISGMIAMLFQFIK